MLGLSIIDFVSFYNFPIILFFVFHFIVNLSIDFNENNFIMIDFLFSFIFKP
jgi:hypothetical protein